MIAAMLILSPLPLVSCCSPSLNRMPRARYASILVAPPSLSKRQTIVLVLFVPFPSVSSPERSSLHFISPGPSVLLFMAPTTTRIGNQQRITMQSNGVEARSHRKEQNGDSRAWCESASIGQGRLLTRLSPPSAGTLPTPAPAVLPFSARLAFPTQ